jgi:hypothetical protein
MSIKSSGEVSLSCALEEFSRLHIAKRVNARARNRNRRKIRGKVVLLESCRGPSTSRLGLRPQHDALFLGFVLSHPNIAVAAEPNKTE